ncbi:hypothetical protein H1W00_06575 [Aeromicrobium sp. Marseille-Q0843]|uniref:Polysaccharide chain length determinant N-terminal domain-containing protein n=1 Tax=Aeromicrobium phoceense TaxID=2754045 RepID=A0A838XHA0_9ACTN|nr:hypothetical protein [Aeromicrobium phoceense]MBA4608138.1 hypothetical protein [Aeromicrobium phoceense]
MLVEVIKTVLRRWYVVVAGLLLTGVLGYAAYSSTPPVYEASGTVLLLPPEDQVSGEGIKNPFLQLNNLDVPTSLVVARLNGDEVREQILEQQPGALYEVTTDPTMRGPVVLVQVSAQSAKATVDTLEAVLAAAPTALTDLQAQQDVPKGDSITSMQLAADLEATAVTRATTRAVVAAVAVGLALTAGATAGIDAIARRRRARRRREADAAPVPATDGTVTSDSTDTDDAVATEPADEQSVKDATSDTDGGTDTPGDEQTWEPAEGEPARRSPRSLPPP